LKIDRQIEKGDKSKRNILRRDKTERDKGKSVIWSPYIKNECEFYKSE